MLFVTSVVLFILQSKDSVTYPPELDTLVWKLMLFKVELTDGNLAHKIKVVRISSVLSVVSL